MSTTQSAYDWLRARIRSGEVAPPVLGPAVESEPELGIANEPVREQERHAEIDRLRGEIEALVAGAGKGGAADAVETALESVARMQVVTANVDACKPPTGPHLERALQALADERLMGHADAIERGMTYTSDNTMRLLRGEK
jgi:hypothetical protein